MGSRGHYISPVEAGRGGPLLYDDREVAGQRIVIVGASLAGATAPATLRDEGFDGDIRLIGAEAQLPYNRRRCRRAISASRNASRISSSNPPATTPSSASSSRSGCGRRRSLPSKSSWTWRAASGWPTTGCW